MHPLSACIDTSNHEFRHDGPIKRRSSLDNSCLTATESVRLILRNTYDNYATNSKNVEYTQRPRRLSLNHCTESAVVVTFLASEQPVGRKAHDLDMDCHDSAHAKPTRTTAKQHQQNQRQRGVIRFGEAELEDSDNFDNENGNSLNRSFFDDDSNDDSDSGSDCGSFCDASVQEPANKEYLVKDLGASAIWSGEASLSDWQLGAEELVDLPNAISEEGEGSEDDENDLQDAHRDDDDDEKSQDEDLRPFAAVEPQIRNAARNRLRNSLTRRRPLKLFRKAVASP